MKCVLCNGELRKGKVNHKVDLENNFIRKIPANICCECGEYYVDTYMALKLEKIRESKYKRI